MFLGMAMLIIVFKFRMGIWGNIRDFGDYFRRSKAVPPAAQKGA